MGLGAAQAFPDVLHRIELRRVGRQRDEGDVGGNLELLGDVMAGPVENERGVSAGRDVAGDLGQAQRHDLGVGGRHDEGGRGAPFGADGAEQIGPFINVGRAGLSGPRSPLGPDPGQRALRA